ncbi:MAG: hypothetical protein NC337_13385 [Roseburia sp.]|nr:hypothetical protein [Roseburia sp.]
MEQLAGEVRRLIYTIICFQCLLQLASGSVYRKYLKLLSYLLTLCICCSVLFSFMGQLRQSFGQADVLYEKWVQEWSEYSIEGGSRQYVE